jgi:hypothetical protein
MNNLLDLVSAVAGTALAFFAIRALANILVEVYKY